MLMQEERELMVEIGKQMSTSGLCPGTSGNQSIYNPELGLMAIKPSGIGYMETTPEDIVIMDLAPYRYILDKGGYIVGNRDIFVDIIRERDQVTLKIIFENNDIIKVYGLLNKAVIYSVHRAPPVF